MAASLMLNKLLGTTSILRDDASRLDALSMEQLRQPLLSRDRAIVTPMEAWDGQWSGVLKPRSLLSRVFISGFSDLWSSAVVFLSHTVLILHMDTILLLLLASGSPCFFFYYHPGGKPWDFSQSWTLVSILLVFPLTMTLSSGYARREAALVQLSQVKANLLSVLLAHLDWDWFTIPKELDLPAVTGRNRLPSDHVGKVYTEIQALAKTLRSMLSAPTVTRARHYHTAEGQKERRIVQDHYEVLSDRSARHIHELSKLTEQFKAAGLPANEASRIRQYTTALMISLQQLRLIKQYRTPLGLRAFSRVYIQMLPVIFGPYYAAMAAATGIAFTICFSLVCSLGLLGLFNLRYAMEDPFISVSGGWDVVDVDRELNELDKDMCIFLDLPTPPPPPSPSLRAKSLKNSPAMRHDETT